MEQFRFLERIARPYVDKELSLSDINKLIHAMNQALMARGFSTSRIVVPEQNLSSGELRLVLQIGYINAVRFAEGSDMVFNVEGTPIYSSYNIEGGVSAFVGAYTMGRGYLEDPQGNIVTDPEILKEQLTGFSMGWSAGFGLEHGQSTNVNGYSFIYNAISSTPTISLSAGWVFYEGNQKDF